MDQIHQYNDFVHHEERKTHRDRIRYFTMPFRPIAKILTCVLISLIMAIPCVMIMLRAEHSSTEYQVAFALLTGVIASGAVSLAMELSGNYRRNYLRLIILHEYLYAISFYEEFVKWCYHGRKDKGDVDPFSSELSVRNLAVAETVLEIGPILEKAYQEGKEYMSLKEAEQVLIAVEAASKIGELAKSLVFDNLEKERRLYDGLKETLRTEIIEFSDSVGIAIPSEDLQNVVADYMLSCPDRLNDYYRGQLRVLLNDFDESMCKLKSIARIEPDYHENLIPWEKRHETMRRKLSKRAAKDSEEVMETLKRAVREKRITQGEMDEYYQLEDEVSREKHRDDVYRVLREKYGDDDDEFDREIKKIVEEQVKEEWKKRKRMIRIMEKAAAN